MKTYETNVEVTFKIGENEGMAYVWVSCQKRERYADDEWKAVDWEIISVEDAEGHPYQLDSDQEEHVETTAIYSAITEAEWAQ